MNGIDTTPFGTLTDDGPLVPNQFPTRGAPYKIAIIGEAPGNDEIEWTTCSKCGHEFARVHWDYQERARVTIAACPQCGVTDFISTPKPFVGASGRFLSVLLGDSNIDRQAVYIGNICQYRPPDNDISKFAWHNRQIQTGLDQLREDMAKFQPNLVVLLGKTALRAAKGTWTDRKGKEQTYSLDDWRGSLFLCEERDSPFWNLKCIATFHPAFLLRVYEGVPLTRFDLGRARKHGCFPQLPVPQLNIDADADFNKIILRLRAIREHHIPFATDIEGWPTYGKIMNRDGRKFVTMGMECISISPTESEAFVIPFQDRQGNSMWSFDQECLLWQELALTLEDLTCEKTLQNGMYDAFVLAYAYKILIRNFKHDTMLLHFEAFPELPKSLACQVSLYCEDIPYYKDERGSWDEHTFWSYCGKDSAVTNRIKTTLWNALKGPRREHYLFNMSLIEPFLYMELRGIKVDTIKRDQMIAQLRGLALFEEKGSGKSKKVTTSGSEQLKLDTMLGYQINVQSNKQMVDLLYNRLGLPMKLKERANGESTPTADYDTLLHYGKKYKNEILLQCIKVRRIRKHCSDLEGTTTDPDGRIRNSVNIVGAKTCRTTSSEAPTGEGTNLQNRTDEDRVIFIPDDGNDWGQLDLSGADGWTVAAHCARLGDSTMLEDYLAGLKPAKNIAVLRLHGKSANDLERSQLKELGKPINAKTDPQNNYVYYASKRIQHGTNYRMGPAKVVNQIYLDTEGYVDISEAEGKLLQQLYLFRYKGVSWWQKWVIEFVQKNGYLDCASGHRRVFFGRKDDPETQNQICSQEPQHNTTYVINSALRRMWVDPENKTTDGKLIIWPCNQIHDALCFQWPTVRREWAMDKLRGYFNNPVKIAGITLTIPFEGTIGQYWGDDQVTFEL